MMKRDKRKEIDKLIKAFKQFMNLNRKQQLLFINRLEMKKEEMNE